MFRSRALLPYPAAQRSPVSGGRPGFAASPSALRRPIADGLSATAAVTVTVYLSQYMGLSPVLGKFQHTVLRRQRAFLLLCGVLSSFRSHPRFSSVFRPTAAAAPRAPAAASVLRAADGRSPSAALMASAASRSLLPRCTSVRRVMDGGYVLLSLSAKRRFPARASSVSRSILLCASDYPLSV